MARGACRQLLAESAAPIWYGMNAWAMAIYVDVPSDRRVELNSTASINANAPLRQRKDASDSLRLYRVEFDIHQLLKE